MSRKFLTLISHLIREVSKLTAVGDIHGLALRYKSEGKREQFKKLAGIGGAGKFSLQRYGMEGSVSMENLDEMISLAREWGVFVVDGVKPRLFAAV